MFPLEFAIFGLMLLGIALFHNKTLEIAVVGLVTVILVKFFALDSFSLIAHLEHEWHILINLAGLLLGFELLSQHFRKSKIPDFLPRILPNDWKGGFVLLAFVFLMSAFLDNIAAAMIGGTIAGIVFERRVHIGYLAAIVAASNAGGAGSVIGDTTTTMMWIDGVSAWDVVHAELGSFVAFLFFAVIAAKQQDRVQSVIKDAPLDLHFKVRHVVLVVMILVGAVVTNITLDFPAVGVWIALLVGSIFCETHWAELKLATRGTAFLVALVLTASLMPVDELPNASALTTLGLGFLSSIFDNIPLTKLALDQGGYDWGVIAYAVGYGGSMTWFGSSAGVALSNIYPDIKSITKWLRAGWPIVVGYVLGYCALILVFGWNPHAPHK